MKISKKTAIAGVVSAIIAVSAATAYADKSHRDRDCDQLAFEQVEQASVTLEQAVKTALGDTPGKVIEVEMDRDRDDTLVWEVEVLNAENQVYEFEIDANSGKILEREKERRRR